MAAAAVLVLVVICGVDAIPGQPCSLAPGDGVIIGTAVARQGSRITLRVDAVRPDPGRRIAIDVGDREVVDYGGDARYLHVGRRYQVRLYLSLYRHRPKVLESGVHTAGENCGGDGTSYADGTAIDTRIPTSTYVRWGVVGAVVLAVAGAVVLTLRGPSVGDLGA